MDAVGRSGRGHGVSDGAVMFVGCVDRLTSPQTVALKLDSMSVVNDAIKNRVSDCGIANNIMPLLDRNLACDEKRALVASIVDNLKEIAPLFGIEDFRPPVVDDKQLRSFD